MERPFKYVRSRVISDAAQSPQIVPHITNAIQDWIERVAKIPVDESGEEPDVCIVEVALCPFRFLLIDKYF